ncbi:MAG: ribose 5-phosphate isomerase B [SAR202 cluster bacterium]|nr:ribose 5-phosphate isomerase B [SAR202 cluster bacterium]|tara:strand:- start:1546 stop:2055 length:510 start_codon:yes stop_codon:yes gene_type:complete
MKQKNNSEIKLIVAVGADHAGYPLKKDLQEWLKGQDIDVIDVGAHSIDPLDDYPDFAAKVAVSVANNEAQRGIVFCGSGVGASIAANKIPGVRASICHDLYSAAQGVEHDDLNVLCLGARIVDSEFAKELIQAFLSAEFTAEERHARRVGKIIELEKNGPQIVNNPQGG